VINFILTWFHFHFSFYCNKTIAVFCIGQYEFLWTLEINIHLSLKASVNIVFKVHTNSHRPQQKTIIVYYHWIDIYVIITITGSISTLLLLSLDRYLHYYYYHWIDILYNYCTWTRSVWGFMEQSTTILNEANAEFNIVVLCSIKPHIDQVQV
jgi:hypothetical protein